MSAQSCVRPRVPTRRREPPTRRGIFGHSLAQMMPGESIRVAASMLCDSDIGHSGLGAHGMRRPPLLHRPGCRHRARLTLRGRSRLILVVHETNPRKHTHTHTVCDRGVGKERACPPERELLLSKPEGGESSIKSCPFLRLTNFGSQHGSGTIQREPCSTTLKTAQTFADRLHDR